MGNLNVSPQQGFWHCLEALENRRLLSADGVNPGGPIITPTPETILHEHKGVRFAADLGNFVSIAPGNNLKASIDWGDGTTSTGMLKADGIVGLDEINFAVDGTHTYHRAGAFAIHVQVFRPGLSPTSPAFLVDSFSDKAIVSRGSTNLDGNITGKYLPAPTAVDIGATYVLTGEGDAGDLGAVKAQGFLTLPGFIVTGHAHGTLTLTSTSKSVDHAGSVTLQLTGPLEKGFGPIPNILDFVIISGTGAFTGASGHGRIDITLTNSSGELAFRAKILSE